MKIKTIDIKCFEWFDKINGNSYFSGTIDINYKLKDWISLNMPFQYGHGTQYKFQAFKEIKKELGIKTDTNNLWSFCEEKNIILREDVKKNCLKRDLLRVKSNPSFRELV